VVEVIAQRRSAFLVPQVILLDALAWPERTRCRGDERSAAGRLTKIGGSKNFKIKKLGSDGRFRIWRSTDSFRKVGMLEDASKFHTSLRL
jgi:hypothetical protein